MNLKTTKRIHRLVGLISVLVGFYLPSTMASPEQERVYLLQLLHQMDALELTVRAAQQEQSPTSRIQFHYTAYRDVAGHLHNGVLEDLQFIRSGVEEKLSENKVQSRIIAPISGDYLADHTDPDGRHE